MTREEFQRLIDERGGLAGPAVIVDPEIDNPNKKKPSDPDKIPNPNPRRKYILNNGTQLEARGSGDEVDAEGRPLEVQITDAGTALRPLNPSERPPTPSGQLDKLDSRGNVIPPTDTTTVVAKLRDPSTGTVTDLPDPKTQPEGKIQEFGNNLLRIMPDGSTTVIATKDPADKQQAKSVIDGPDGKYEYDPNKPEGQRTTLILKKPPDQTKPQTEVRNGVTYQWDPDAKTWTEAAGLPTERKPATASVNTAAKYIVYYDDQGNEISRNPNPNYQPPTPTQLTPDTVSPNIPLLKADGTVQWVPNQNRVPASQAMQDLLAQVGVKVNSGDMAMGDAKEMLTGAVNVMNAQTAQVNAQTQQLQAQTAQQQAGTQAATGALTALGQGAQTGAGMLQNRVTAATGLLNNILGLAGQGQRSGNMGGGLMAAPAGLGEQLVGGIQGWTTELGGGQGIYDTAARMVQQADPTASPMAQTAYGVLGQMLEKYKQVTGEDHPAVAATQAAQQSQQAGGMVAPVTTGLTPQQLANRAAAGRQLQAATAQFGAPFGAAGIAANPMAAAMPQPQPVAPPTTMPFVAPQTGMASLFVPGNPFTAPVTVPLA